MSHLLQDVRVHLLWTSDLPWLRTDGCNADTKVFLQYIQIFTVINFDTEGSQSSLI
jgi:hypothetical protein